MIARIAVLGLAVLLNGISVLAADPPAVERLWPVRAPGATGDRPEDTPTLTIWRPTENAAKTAIVVCPGGGYGHLALDHEGKQIAQWLNSLGITAAVLEYRHRGKGYAHPAPLTDAQRAIRLVRSRAEALDIDAHRVGIIGFSAGGHLASTAATHFDTGNPQADDPVDRVSCRPDFAILCYAVIAFGEPFTHAGSQHNLLGKDAPPELVQQFSNEKQVSAETPPCFIWHTDEDRVVPSENSVMFYLACRKHKVPAELHIYRSGQHGVGLAAKINGANLWPKQCELWLRGQGFLPKQQP